MGKHGSMGIPEVGPGPIFTKVRRRRVNLDVAYGYVWDGIH